MFLSTGRIRRINRVVAFIAMSAILALLGYYWKEHGKSSLKTLPHLFAPLAALAVTATTFSIINRLSTTGARMEEEIETMRAKKLYADLFEMARDAIIVHDSEGRIESVNDAAAQLLGLSRGSLEADNLFRYIRSGQCLAEEGADQPKTGITLLSLDRPDGATIKGEAVSTRFYQDGREKYLLIVRDVTEKEKYQDRIKRLEKLATLGEVSAKISHEINNPLTTIVACAEMGHEKSTDVKITGYFNNIQGQAERIIRITQNYLKFSHPGRSNKRSEDPGDIVRDAISFFIMSGQGKFLKVQEEISPALPSVLADRNKIIQALLNLFINAAHATEKTEHPRLTVKVSPAEEPWGLSIQVADNGCGIPTENQNKIFDPFFTTKEEGKGTGLGLALVREIIQEEHGGTVRFTSTPGEGTSFTLALPEMKEGENRETQDSDRG